MASLRTTCDRQVSRNPRLVGGVKGHNQNEISFPGSRALGGELHSIKNDYHHFSPFELNRTLRLGSPKQEDLADVQLSNIIKFLGRCHFV